MNRCVVTCALTILVFGSNAVADRCVGPKDDWVTGPPYNIPLVDPADIVFCDDFDSYCSTNYYDNVRWPGYPPTPDTTLCESALDMTYSEWWLKQHWPKPYSGGPQFGMSNADPDQGGVRLEGWDGNPGWASLPFVAQSSGNQDGYNDPNRGSAYAVFDMSDAIAHRFPGSTAVNGTDDFPLVLRYWLSDDQSFSQFSQVGWGMVNNWPWYMELFHGNDNAPTDYAIFNASYCPHPYGWPVVCQQAPGTAPGLPAGCPPLSTVVHSSLTFGWMAPLDTNPCDVETGRRPTMYHAATFDGLYWTRLKPGMYPGNGGAFQYSMQQAYFEMTIRSTTYTVRLIAPVDTIQNVPRGECTADCYQIRISTATLPRRYLGPFNKIAMGIAPGCELDPATGACKAGTVRDQHAWWWDDATCHWVDRVIVYGGVGNLTPGACCVRDDLCQSLTATACETANGRFHGSGVNCGSVECCPMPFADADHDGDVDLDDFGRLQTCLTGTARGVPPGCGCFERNNNHGIDAGDIAAFMECVTGSNVPWSQALTPNCSP